MRLNWAAIEKIAGVAKMARNQLEKVMSALGHISDKDKRELNVRLWTISR
jgi:hypothetical protein